MESESEFAINSPVQQSMDDVESAFPPLAPTDELIPPPPEPLASVARQVAQESTKIKPTTSIPSTLPGTQSVHQFSQAEKTAFVKHINTVLGGHAELESVIPVDPNTNDIFEAVKDGILLW